MLKKRRQKYIVGPRQMRNRVNTKLKEYYAKVEREDMYNLG